MTANETTERQQLPLRTGRVYRHLPAAPAARTQTSNSFWAALDGVFDRKRDMNTWLDTLMVPASGRWIFGRIPRTGTTIVVAALHFLEFGTPITTTINSPSTSGSDNEQNALDSAGVFMSPLQTTHGPEILSDAFRFTVIRHPARRAISSFRYLCKSQMLGSAPSAPLRLRMSAMVKFDWERDIYTAKGYDKFLDFVEASLEFGRFPIDHLIAPQTACMNRTALKPDFVGRTEEMAAVLDVLCERFGRRLPPRATRPHLDPNRKEVHMSISDAAVAKTAEIFAEDFEWYESLD